jgi:hypothetical protein
MSSTCRRRPVAARAARSRAAWSRKVWAGSAAGPRSGAAGIRPTCPVTVPSWSTARDSLACLSSMSRFQPRHGVGRGRRAGVTSSTDRAA